MKLVDILARELKVWPHSGNALGQAQDTTLHLNEHASHGGKFYGWTKEKFTRAEDHHEAFVTRAQWQAAADALNDIPKFPSDDAEWTGEGLPPVGTTCETRFTDIEGSSWRGAIILAHGARRIFLRENSGDEFAQRIDECEFRPFRTPEQIAAEEIQKIRDEINWQRPYLGPCPVEKLYRLGYRKQKDS